MAMFRALGLAVAAAMVALASPAPAQRSNSEDLLTAIREGDDGRVLSIVEANGSSAINMRGFDGATALTLAAQGRKLTYLQFLLSNKADPDLANRDGDTPLIVAARLGWMEGATELLSAHAAVDAANKAGETALIVAVHRRNIPMIRRLLQAGADPDKTDRAAGMSAREYAARDNRVREILRLIESARPAKPSL